MPNDDTDPPVCDPPTGTATLPEPPALNRQGIPVDAIRHQIAGLTGRRQALLLELVMVDATIKGLLEQLGEG